MLAVLQKVLFIPVVLAQVPTDLMPPATRGACGAIWNGTAAPGQGFSCIATFIAQLTLIVISFVASLSLVMLMINGFRYMYGPAIPGGSSDAAKKGIGASLLGLAVSLLTYLLLDTLVSSVT
jgi:hypothetical protein